MLGLVLAEDGEGFVEAAGFPEGLDRSVEDHQAEAGRPFGVWLGGRAGSRRRRASPVVLATPEGDRVGDQAATGEAPGLGGQLGPPTGRGGFGEAGGRRRVGSKVARGPEGRETIATLGNISTVLSRRMVMGRRRSGAGTGKLASGKWPPRPAANLLCSPRADNPAMNLGRDLADPRGLGRSQASFPPRDEAGRPGERAGARTIPEISSGEPPADALLCRFDLGSWPRGTKTSDSRRPNPVEVSNLEPGIRVKESGGSSRRRSARAIGR